VGGEGMLIFFLFRLGIGSCFAWEGWEVWRGRVRIRNRERKRAKECADANLRLQIHDCGGMED
jgi:hypothetical protein